MTRYTVVADRREDATGSTAGHPTQHGGGSQSWNLLGKIRPELDLKTEEEERG